jgi:uncharacterized protein
MLDGFPLADVHLHAARLPTLKSGWMEWAQGFGDAAVLAGVYDPEGTIVPAAFDAYLAAEGVDVALLLAEYSPKVTGMQVIEDLLPVSPTSTRTCTTRSTRRCAASWAWARSP